MNPVTILQALQVAEALSTLVMKAATQLQGVSKAINDAQKDGNRPFTDAEIAIITQPSVDAIDALEDAIKQARAAEGNR